MDYEIMMNGNVKVGQIAPDFEARTTLGIIRLDDYKGKWIVLFSYPGDFNPICTTEVISFEKARLYLEKLNTNLIGLTTDGVTTHLTWNYNIFCKTRVKISFPIIADKNGEIARKYGMISNEITTTEALRNIFIIDPKGIIRLIMVYPLNIGRNIGEIIRALEALQIADKDSE